MRRGFFVPNSASGNYVANKKTNEGAYQWDQADQEVSLGKHAALQTIDKQYSTTINDAYSQYLMASRGLRGADMGEGYKEAYAGVIQKQLADQIAQVNMTAENARQELNKDAASMQDIIKKTYEGEVANIDRTLKYAGDYLAYLKSLSTIDNKKYFTPDEEVLSIDDMYDAVWNAQPGDNYIDMKGDNAMSFTAWVNASLKSTEADTKWSQWLFGMGGLDQAKAAAKKGVKK